MDSRYEKLDRVSFNIACNKSIKNYIYQNLTASLFFLQLAYRQSIE